MTETHEIRYPEWPHIHERDNRIIELEAEVKRLRGEIVERHRLGDDLTARLEILRCDGEDTVAVELQDLPVAGEDVQERFDY